MPPTSLLHPGIEAAVGLRLIIRQETIAYLAAFICRGRSTIHWMRWVSVTALLSRIRISLSAD